MEVEEWLGPDNQLGIEIWHKKYQYKDESFDNWLDRVSGSNVNIRQLILEKKFLFGGRILANRGLDKKGVKVTYSNCFTGNTEIRTRNGIQNMAVLENRMIEVFSKGTWRNATVRSFGEQPVLKLTVSKGKSVATYEVTSNHIWFAKSNPKKTFEEITTDQLKSGMILEESYTKCFRTYKPSPFGVAHGLFFGDGDHTGDSRRMALCGDKMELAPYFMPDTFGISNGVMTINGIPKIFWKTPDLDETPAYLYGWLSGYFAADGSVDKRGNCVICSSDRKNLEFVQDVLCVLGMPVYEIRCQNRVSNLTNEASDVFILTLDRKFLNESFFIRSIHKERYLANANKIKNTYWTVKSIEETGRIEPVYCVVEPETHSFTLKNGVLTHNCYVITPPEDSIESIFETAGKLARTFSYGGGAGIDLSKLAPRGAKINNTALQTSGAVSFTDLYSMVTDLIGQNGRRGALMLSISDTHPDLEEFISVKTDLSRVTKANMSVRITDSFMHAVNQHMAWILDYKRPETNDVVTKYVDAAEVFHKLCEANYDYGEPGCLFWDNIRNGSMLQYCDDFEFAGTNPCAEQPLPAGGSCLLGSINLAAFVENGEFDYHGFDKAVYYAVMALNEVLDEGMLLHPLKEQRESVKKWRQIGLGIMGLGDMLVKMGVKYGSEESLRICDRIGSQMFNTALTSSQYYAQGHGYVDCLNDLKKSQIMQNHEAGSQVHWLANTQLLTIAPTGSISTMIGVSGGIEPIFAKSFTRTTKSLSDKDEVHVVHPKVIEEFMQKMSITDDADLPDFMVTAEDVYWKDRVLMQSIWQKHIDASISSTINLPEDTTVETVEQIYKMAWETGCKGVTIFRAGCKRDAILTATPKEDALVINKDAGDDIVGKKRKLMTGCGSLHFTAFFDPKTGDLKETYLSKGSTGGCNNFMVGLSRMISLSARSGCSVEEIVDQLRSTGSCPSYAVRRATKGDTSVGACCPMAVGNALIEMHDEMMREIEGRPSVAYKTKVVNPCPKCGAELEFSGGCNICKSCGWTKCD